MRSMSESRILGEWLPDEGCRLGLLIVLWFRRFDFSVFRRFS